MVKKPNIRFDIKAQEPQKLDMSDRKSAPGVQTSCVNTIIKLLGVRVIH